MLVQLGADMNKENRAGLTAAMAATMCDRVESFNALVARGCQVDYENKRGQTALIVACSELKNVRPSTA
jgi:ankyrin repeat protein